MFQSKLLIKIISRSLFDVCCCGKRNRLKKSNDKKESPMTAPHILDRCDTDVFSIICGFFLVFATLSVTNASAERSFSSLRRLKIYGI